MPNKGAFRRYTEEEKQFFLDRLGVTPIERIYANYQTWAYKRRLPQRSQSAVKVYFRNLAFKQGVGYKTTEDNLNVVELSRQIGIPTDRIRRWVRNGMLPAKKYAHIWRVRVCQVRKFLKKRPDLFHGISRLGLAILFDDDMFQIDKWDRIISDSKHAMTKAEVRATQWMVEDSKGVIKRFDSLVAIASHYHVGKHTVWKYTRRCATGWRSPLTGLLVWNAKDPKPSVKPQRAIWMVEERDGTIRRFESHIAIANHYGLSLKTICNYAWRGKSGWRSSLTGLRVWRSDLEGV
ncbi:MAG: hypothetical protein DDT26_01514 [Dehalococcoidia bacterium]|nr:hypothetical protein [Chloroflexota bacterium]